VRLEQASSLLNPGLRRDDELDMLPPPEMKSASRHAFVQATWTFILRHHTRIISDSSALLRQ
jgi:hypothetical protein